MDARNGRRYGIAEVAEMTDVPIHVLRRWEDAFDELRPKRDRANHRWYTAEDVSIVRWIRRLLWDDKMKTEGAQRRLAEILRGETHPRNRQETVQVLEQMEQEICALLKRLDQ